MNIRLLSLSLLLVCATAFAAEKANPFEKEILAFEASDKTNPPPKNAILFIGSSSIRMWKNVAKDLPDYRVINRGFGGSQISDSIHYADRIVIPYAPNTIVFYAGGNDMFVSRLGTSGTLIGCHTSPPTIHSFTDSPVLHLVAERPPMVDVDFSPRPR